MAEKSIGTATAIGAAEVWAVAEAASGAATARVITSFCR